MSNSNNATGTEKTRKLRDRKFRKLYSDEWALADDEIDGHHTFDLIDKLESDRFSQNYVKEMQGADFNIQYLQSNGFKTPILFREKSGLGLQVPSKNFSINDVKLCVGSRRKLDVMDVNTQKNFEMSMREWERYYNKNDRDRLLNVISLEFSHTKLEHYVQAPSVVRQIDWVNSVWPQFLKESQCSSTNAIDEMKYPKVQKYCLMSVKDCYTDFHIDFGGTSVWYHILKGSKIFWLIPPTEQNVQEYEKWVLSGKQGDIFFGDTVDSCGRILLTAGNTFFIPTGWIHAVFTPEDSLVFGGNFLHSYGMDKQLRIAQVEDTTRVPKKFRYPFFTEMLWYVLEKYVHRFYGVSHLDETDESNNDVLDKYVHLTPWEYRGLKAIIFFLHDLPLNKKNIPDLITDPRALVKNVRKLLEEHRNDDPVCAVTGEPVLKAPAEKPRTSLPYVSPEKKVVRNQTKVKKRKYKKTGMYQLKKKGKAQRRRTRCRNCEACQHFDCGECIYCLDMPKFGGPGKAKQTCVKRNCLQPVLPTCAVCKFCDLDGWGEVIKFPVVRKSHEGSTLMECCVCYDIAHRECMEEQCPGTKGINNDDLPNSWECPMCCQNGKNLEYKPRHFKARRIRSVDARLSSSSNGAYNTMKPENAEIKGENDYYSDGETCYSPHSTKQSEDDVDDDDDDDDDDSEEQCDSSPVRHSGAGDSFKRASSEGYADLYGKRGRRQSQSGCGNEQPNNVCIDMV
ncbi:jmjC domain-containing histone demethylation protein 1-like [Nilaparvata lugens]|uniref:jmjC domain-containing histone demethylation protein 1-like n=1 Tax=Nilaparvata lugens TaxID=108931 RepID=UPI00193D4D69|nr:jmjC domain-containing histone demethylation protein 1-like [Nilaparvata lugens]